MTTLEAKLRITAETAQASAAVKQLGKDAGAIPAGVAPAATALETLGRKTEENTRRVKDATYRLGLLRPQITDIVTGLATGQSPFTVLLQQGGQLGDVFGGFGNALKALGTVFTPFRLLLGGVGAALGTVAFQAFQSSQSLDALEKTVALTGNATILTTARLKAMTDEIANAQKVSATTARESLDAVVATGRFTGAAVLNVASAVTALGKANGLAAAENVKVFATLLDNTLAKTLALNQQYNFLTIEQLKMVQQLVAQSREMEAAQLVSDQFTQAMRERTTPAVTALGKAWEQLKLTLGGVVERTRELLFGNDAPEKKLEALRVRLADLQRKSGANPGATEREAQAALASQIALFEARLLRDDQAAVDANERKERAVADGKKLEKGYQDSLTAITAAGAQKRLAQELAKLEERKSAVEREHALGLVGEQDFAAKLNAIEVARLGAQRQALQTQLKAEQSKLVEGGNSTEQNAQRARVLQLEGQLVEMGARIKAAVAKGATDAGAAQTAEARTQAQAYAEVWQRAAQQVAQFAQTAAETQARLTGDPARRAQAEADAATAALRRQKDELERDLGNQIATNKDPNQAAVLQAQLDALRASAGAAIAEAGRAVQLRSLQASAAEAQAQLAAQEQAVALRVQAGQLTAADGEQQTLALRRQQLPVLERILALIDAIATTPEEKNQAASLRLQITAAADLRSELDKTARSQAVSGLASALTDIATRAKTGKEALQDMVAGFAKAMLDVLHRKLAEQLVNQFITAAGKSGGGGSLFSSIRTFIAGLFHSGGIAGQASPGSRAVNPLAFALAPRYHSGNTGDLLQRMGVRSNERAVIVEDDEEILTAKNPRHVKNFRGGGGGGALSISVGDVNVSGAGGDEATLRDAGQGLRETIVAAASEWVMNQHRPGGVFGRR